MLKKIVQNYLSSSTDLAGNSLLRLKFMIVNAYTVIGCSYVFAHGIFNILRQFYILGGLEILGGIAVIVNILLLRKTKNIEFAGGVILLLMLCLFISLIVFGQDDKTGLYWFFTFPLLAFFLKGIKKGFIWIMFQFMIIIAMTVMSELNFMISIPYTIYEIVVLCMSIMAGILLVYFYELMKNELVSMQKKQQDDQFERRILREQFDIAERIQKLLIPHEDCFFANIAVSGYYKAASGVGGDYFDFFKMDEDHTAVIVSDVSGKSVSGAFVMVNIRSIFQHNITAERMSPAEMVKIINRRLLSDATNDIFATLSVYFFDAKNRALEFCHAGYGPMTYYSAHEKNVLEIPFNSLPAGVIDDESKYSNQRLQMGTGDIILSYTDGLLESFEKKFPNNGKAMLYQTVCECAAGSAADVKSAIIARIADLTLKGVQHDDISLVVARIG